MIGSAEMGRIAMRHALNVRSHLGIAQFAPICVFDVADKLGIEVRFRPEKSLDGMYVKGPRPTILVSAHRPPGHRAFTCAHELGHHKFNHGTQIDEYVEGIENTWHRAPEEWLANRFAAFLLMPRAAVVEAFKRRRWIPGTCSAIQAFTIAGQLGVGYSTIVTQMARTLALIPETRAKSLKRITPKTIREELVSSPGSRRLLIVDSGWDASVAADLEVGDHILLPKGAVFDNTKLAHVEVNQFGTVLASVRSGVSQVELPNTTWNVYVRASEFRYTGRSTFRYLEESDGD